MKKADKQLLDKYNTAVKLYSNRVCRLVHKVLKDENYAKDISQEAFIKLWDNRHSVDFDKARAWLFTVAYRLSLDYLKAKKNNVSDDFLVETIDIQEENFDLKRVLNEALDRLPEIQRTIILLKDYEGYKYNEIGEILSVSESQVKVYLFRGRNKMKEYIGNLKVVI